MAEGVGAVSEPRPIGHVAQEVMGRADWMVIGAELAIIVRGAPPNAVQDSTTAIVRQSLNHDWRLWGLHVEQRQFLHAWPWA
jgi:hypothetical protein